MNQIGNKKQIKKLIRLFKSRLYNIILTDLFFADFEIKYAIVPVLSSVTYPKNFQSDS